MGASAYSLESYVPVSSEEDLDRSDMADMVPTLVALWKCQKLLVACMKTVKLAQANEILRAE